MGARWDKKNKHQKNANDFLYLTSLGIKIKDSIKYELTHINYNKELNSNFSVSVSSYFWNLSSEEIIYFIFKGARYSRICKNINTKEDKILSKLTLAELTIYYMQGKNKSKITNRHCYGRTRLGKVMQREIFSLIRKKLDLK